MASSEIIYPLALVCGFAALILISGLGVSYLAMLAISARNRTCPNCGKRGGNIISTETLATRSERSWQQPGRRSLVTGGRPKLIETTEETYEDRYECERCGHQWTLSGRQITRTPIPIGGQDNRPKP